MTLSKYILTAFVLFFLLGCNKKVESNLTLQKSRLKYSFLETQRELLSKVRSAGKTYINDVAFFENLPAQYALDDCQQSWKKWYNEFLLMSPYRYFYGDLDAGFEEYQNDFDLSGINYGFIDYTASQPNGGIIKDVTNYPNINQVNMISWHQSGGEYNAALGFHVLEFLLWGEDLSLNTTGVRNNSDYLQTSAENERRMKYLSDASGYLKLIIDGIKIDSEYKNDILSSNSDETFKQIIEGFNRFILEDLIEKTIQKPLDSQNPLDELSDFSDNTLENIKSKIKGLRYALNGSELFISSEEKGYFMIDFISDVDKEAESDLIRSLDEIDNLLAQITVEFEKAIQNASMREKLNSITVELSNIHSILDKMKQVNFG